MKSLVNILLAFVILTFGSCGLNSSNKNSFNEHERKMVEEELATFKHGLPYEIAGSGFVMTNIEIVGDMVIYTCQVSKENWDAISLTQEVSSSERNIARVISNLDKEAIAKFIKSGFGIKYEYVSQENDSTLLEVEVQPNKLKEVFEKLEKGEIEPYSLLEITKMELAKMEIPSKMDDGLWLTDAYVEGQNIYYIITFEYEVDKSNISVEDIEEVKNSCITYIREEPLITTHKKEVLRENVHFVYIYKDSRGKECMRISIAPQDVF